MIHYVHANYQSLGYGPHKYDDRQYLRVGYGHWHMTQGYVQSKDHN